MDSLENKKSYQLLPESNFFGEYVIYSNPEEKLEAKIYLNLWKKFFFMKNKDLKLVSEQIIDRPGIYTESMIGISSEKISTLGIKIEVK